MLKKKPLSLNGSRLTLTSFFPGGEMVLHCASAQSRPKLTIGRLVRVECCGIQPWTTLSLPKPSNSSFGFVSPTLCSYFISYQCALKKKSSLASLLGYIPSRQSSNFSYPFGYLVVATAPMISLSFLTVGTQLFQRFSKLL